MTPFLRQYLQLVSISIVVSGGLFFCDRTHAQNNSRLSVIANNSVPVDSISKSELKALFMGDKKKWSLNMLVVPVYLD